MEAMDVCNQHSSVDVASLVQNLREALLLEGKFQSRLQLPSSSANGGDPGEITTTMRDGAAHVLRCLKVWYDLPSSVLLVALNLMDRFMSRMKARPKHLSCIAISSFHLAALQWSNRTKGAGATVYPYESTAQSLPNFQVPEPQDLVTISQCKCTAGDISRMEKIIEEKLGCNPNEEPVTIYTFLGLYHSLLSVSLARLITPAPELDLLTLSHKLEMICCDSANASPYRPSQLALALLASEMDRILVGQPEDKRRGCHAILLELLQMSGLTESALFDCKRTVSSVLAPYDGYGQAAPSHRQRLTWKLSRRTLKLLRPTEKLVNVLPTIEENRQFGHHAKRNRRSQGLSPRKSRPSAAPCCLPLPFPTKEDFASFFDNNLVASAQQHPFRFLFGQEDGSQRTA